MRLIGEQQLDDIALGAGILGTGGGGDPYIGKLLAREAIRRHGPVRVVTVDEIDADALVIPTAMMGAPTVMVEKLPSGDELERAFAGLQRRLGAEAVATMPVEVGGINSVLPFCLATRLGIPLVDADFMGRAFPEVQMCIPGLYGISAAPMTVADEKGNVSTLDVIDNRWAERLARSHTIDMGCSALVAQWAVRGRQLREAAVLGSLTAAERLGASVRAAQLANADPIAAVLDGIDGHRLFDGKVVDVARQTSRGFARAEVRLDGIGGDADAAAVLRTQNEHLVLERDGEVLASVPDLIIVLDSDSGQPITTEELRYGFRVTVVAGPCDPRWRTPAGLELVGPRYFGYDFDYVPIEQLAERAAA